MGLDMYLHKRTYVGNKYRKEKELIKIQVPKDQKKVTFPIAKDQIQDKRISSIEEEVAYWRKANHIHAWFVKNVQDGNDDCKDYYVSREKLQELLDIVEKVIKASKLVPGNINAGYTYKDGKRQDIIEKGKVIADPTLAKELLPTQEGFFFGGTGYDEYYLGDLKETKKMLTEALKDENGEFYYTSSW